MRRSCRTRWNSPPIRTPFCVRWIEFSEARGNCWCWDFSPGAWGMRARWSRTGFPPGMRRVLSERRLREWLVLLGFEVIATQHYLYLGPWSRGLASGEGTGRMLRRGLTYPLPAGAYLLRARKRVYTLTPIRLRFREKPAVIGGLVKPTTRSRA